MGILLQHVHFHSLSVENLLRLGRATLSGTSGDDLHREVQDALTSRRRTQSSGTFQSKRWWLQHWSPILGASCARIEASGQEVLPLLCKSLCWHQGETVLLRTVGVTASLVGSLVNLQPACEVLQVKAATVAGINDLGPMFDLAISPSGEMFVADWQNRMLLRFQNGSGDLVVGNTDAGALFCSPNGVLYALRQNGRAVAKAGGLHARDCDCIREPSGRHEVQCGSGVL